jgi:hypothetical protein
MFIPSGWSMTSKSVIVTFGPGGSPQGRSTGGALVPSAPRRHGGRWSS